MIFTYNALLCGGCGPNTWDKEIRVEAENISIALKKVIKIIKADIYGRYEVDNIVSIEQVD